MDEQRIHRNLARCATLATTWIQTCWFIPWMARRPMLPPAQPIYDLLRNGGDRCCRDTALRTGAAVACNPAARACNAWQRMNSSSPPRSEKTGLPF